MRKALLLSSLIIFVALSAFILNNDDPVPIPPSPQRTEGNAKKGYEYLVNGDYIRSGIPYSIYLFGAGADKTNYLKREGINATISHQFTAVKATNGEVVVAPNCLNCHAQVFDDKLIVGLGNSFIDFTRGKKFNLENIELLEKLLKLKSGKQYEAANEFIRASKAITEQLYAPVKGVNVADRLAYLLVAHRAPGSFTWSDEAQLNIPKELVPTDTPPWWLLKKKNAMFYNGFGRGDFGKFLMASNLLTVTDTSEARNVDEHMPDVLAYIYSLKPPVYPKPVDKTLAAKGKVLFEHNCSTCHGTYGNHESYPNYLIPASVIKTDSALYKANYSSPQFIDWFNKSWFTQGNHPAQLVPFEGYIAPPLDGIWVSAPYLHNGSVPTLEALLNSKVRPIYWSRDFDKPQYDYDKVGWKFSVEKKGESVTIYNTTLTGYGNYGHYFGDALTDNERKSVIEYLKTL
ncbi:MAG: c-type cytochrome [Bacteroidota bacterium]|nr:c-type cytochrome [Bacteroidota bacterium]